MMKQRPKHLYYNFLTFFNFQMAALADVRKKWHIPPAFSVEFIGYYLDRITRLNEIKTSLQEQLESNKHLVEEQKNLREEYDQVSSYCYYPIFRQL